MHGFSYRRLSENELSYSAGITNREKIWMSWIRARELREALSSSEQRNFEDELAKIDLKKELKNARVFLTQIIWKWTQLVRRNSKLWKTFIIVVARARNSRSVKVKWEKNFE